MSRPETQTVSIIGIGHVGRLVLQGLLQHGSPLQINLVDIGDAAPGYALDAMHAALFDGMHQIAFNKEELCTKSDFIFHCAGPSVPPGADRNQIRVHSKDITHAIFANRTWHPNARVIVITNPVEPVCKYVAEFSGIAPNQIFGTGTSIDTTRLQHFLAKEYLVKPDKAQTMMVGEHGAGMIALQSHSYINGVLVRDGQKWQAAVEQTIHAASTIKSFTGYTSIGPAQAALELWQVLTGQKTSVLPFSCYDSMHVIPGHPPTPSWFSLPIHVTGNHHQAILPDSLADNELFEILRVASKLVEQAEN